MFYNVQGKNQHAYWYQNISKLPDDYATLFQSGSLCLALCGFKENIELYLFGLLASFFELSCKYLRTSWPKSYFYPQMMKFAQLKIEYIFVENFVTCILKYTTFVFLFAIF